MLVADHLLRSMVLESITMHFFPTKIVFYLKAKERRGRGNRLIPADLPLIVGAGTARIMLPYLYNTPHVP